MRTKEKKNKKKENIFVVKTNNNFDRFSKTGNWKASELAK